MKWEVCKTINDMDENKKERLIFFLILFAGSLVRLIGLGKIPDGLNQDEAYSAYEAWSMLNYGYDSWGYHNPVYLTVWGSGQSALNSYLMIPFIACLGAYDWVIRIPSAIIGCLTLIAVYYLLKELFPKENRIPRVGMFLLAISPWHIAMSRWALDCNLAAGFMVFGLLFFMKGIRNCKYYVLSGLFYGLSLYCYSLLWLVIPIILLGQFIILIRKRKLVFTKYTIFGLFILLILACPLIAFVIINIFDLPDIRLSFLSIPRMVVIRSDEITLKNIGSNFVNLLMLLVKQYDGHIFNGTPVFGMYYQFSTPFVGLGIYDLWLRQKEKTDNIQGSSFVILQISASVFAGLVVSMNISRFNFMHIWMILLITLGINRLVYLIKNLSYKKVVKGLLESLYLLSFFLFIGYYFIGYSRSEELAKSFNTGVGKAIEKAETTGKDIYLCSAVLHPKALWYGKVPPNEYMDSVEYEDYDSKILQVNLFGKYYFTFDNVVDIKKRGIWIVNSCYSNREDYEGIGYETYGLYDYIDID